MSVVFQVEEPVPAAGSKERTEATKKQDDMSDGEVRAVWCFFRNMRLFHGMS